MAENTWVTGVISTLLIGVIQLYIIPFITIVGEKPWKEIQKNIYHTEISFYGGWCSHGELPVWTKKCLPTCKSGVFFVQEAVNNEIPLKSTFGHNYL